MPGAEGKKYERTSPSASEIAEDREMLTKAARIAGELALDIRKAGIQKIKKPDGSPVTNADLAVNDYLEKTLRADRPDYAWLSEESEDGQARQSAERTFIVDPIDGTADFIAGTPSWCIALAILQKDKLMAAAIFNPMTNEMFAASLKQGATCNGSRLTVSKRQTLDDCLILSNPFFERPEWPVPWPKMRVKPGGSCGCRMADIAAGRADAYLSLNGKWDWDAAPGALLITEAGGVVTDTFGAPFAYNQDNPRQRNVIAAPPGLHALILERTRFMPLPLPAAKAIHKPGKKG